MILTDQEKAILEGKEGEARQQAMKMLVEYGTALGVDRLLDVDDVQFGFYCPYPPFYHGGRQFKDYEELFSYSSLGSYERLEIPKVKASRCINLGGKPEAGYLDYLGIDEPKVREGIQMTDQFIKDHGINNVRTCTPHLVGHLAIKGEHLVCGESSQVIMLNSVFGARVNCETAVLGGSAAVVGKIPNSGLHLDENRRGTHLIKVDRIPSKPYQWDLLGYWIGKRVGIGVPVLEMDVPFITLDQHKSMGGLP